MNQHHCSAIESLEARIAPAVLIDALNPKLASYTDVDGDQVSLMLSKGAWTAGMFTTKADGFGELLQRIDLTGKTALKGAKIVVTAVPGISGNGFADVGEILAEGLDLHTVLVDGDLARIVVGDSNPKTAALKQLTVHSFGKNGGANLLNPMNVNSEIDGSLGRFDAGSFGPVHLTIAASNKTNVKVGAIDISGNLTGGMDAYAGNINVTGSVGFFHVGGTIKGGGGLLSGAVSVEGKIGSFFAGAIEGGAGISSGRVVGVSNIGHLEIAGAVKGGSGFGSGQIIAARTIGHLEIGSDIQGGMNVDAGQVKAGRIKLAEIGGDLLGSGVAGTGTLVVDFASRIFVSGVLKGSGGENSGTLQVLDPHARVSRIEVGGITGGSGPGSGGIHLEAARIGSIAVHGDVIGGSDNDTGLIDSTGPIGRVTVDGNLEGGINFDISPIDWSGALRLGRAGSVFIGGDMKGGSSILSSIDHSGAIDTQGGIGLLSIGGSFISTGSDRATISGTPRAVLGGGSHTVFGKIEIGGDMTGSDILTRGDADAVIGSVFVGGQWKGSNLAAGVVTGGDFQFGTADDTHAANAPDNPKHFSKIARVVIQGAVLNTASALDHFGIVADRIGKVSINGAQQQLSPAKDNLPVADLSILELA